MGWGGSVLDQNCNNKNGSLWMAGSLDLMGSIGHTNGCLDLSVFYLTSVIFKLSCKVNCFKVSTKGFLNTKNHSSACICICICICYMLWLPTIDDTLVHSIYELVPGVEGLRLV